MLRAWQYSIVLLVVAGCGGDDGLCPKVSGIYQPLYVQRSGNCGPVAQANNVPIYNNIEIQKFANVDVETETIVMGCSLKMTQTVRDKMGVPQRIFDGSALNVESSNMVAGMVTLTQYDAAGVAICWGEYDAQFEKDTTTIGGAASGN